jgi:3-isopropylmalate dehydratase small subunit
LPITIAANIIQELSEYIKIKEEIEINLKEQEILYGNKKIKFDLDPAKKKRLIDGLDEISIYLKE